MTNADNDNFAAIYGVETLARAVAIAQAGRCPRHLLGFIDDPDRPISEDPDAREIAIKLAEIAGVSPGEIHDNNRAGSEEITTALGKLTTAFPGSTLLD